MPPSNSPPSITSTLLPPPVGPPPSSPTHAHLYCAAEAQHDMPATLAWRAQHPRPGAAGGHGSRQARPLLLLLVVCRPTLLPGPFCGSL